MAKVVPLSFKENDRDKTLYHTVCGKSDRSAFIKDAIEFYIDNVNNLKVPNKVEQKTKSEDYEDDNEGILGIISVK